MHKLSFLPSENMPFSLQFTEKSAFPLLTLPSFRSLDSPFFNFKPKKSFFPFYSWFKSSSTLSSFEKNTLLTNLNNNSKVYVEDKSISKMDNNTADNNSENSNNFSSDCRFEDDRNSLKNNSDKTNKIASLHNMNKMNFSPKYKERKKFKRVSFGDDMWGMDREEFEENFSPKERQLNSLYPGKEGWVATPRSPKSPRRSPDRRNCKHIEEQNFDKRSSLTTKSPRKSIVINNKAPVDIKVKNRAEKRRVSIKMKKEEMANKKKRRIQLQLNYLSSEYEKEKNWSEEKIKGISGLTGLSEHQIKTWFNRVTEKKNINMNNMNFSEFCLLSFK